MLIMKYSAADEAKVLDALHEHRRAAAPAARATR